MSHPAGGDPQKAGTAFGSPPTPQAAAGHFLAPAEQSTPLCREKWEGKHDGAARTMPAGCFCRDRVPTASQRGHPLPAQASPAADPLFGWLRASSGARPQRWVHPGHGRQLTSSSPGFSHMPLFFFSLVFWDFFWFFFWCVSCVMAWASGGFLPLSSLGKLSRAQLLAGRGLQK